MFIFVKFPTLLQISCFWSEATVVVPWGSLWVLSILDNTSTLNLASLFHVIFAKWSVSYFMNWDSYPIVSFFQKCFWFLFLLHYSFYPYIFHFIVIVSRLCYRSMLPLPRVLLSFSWPTVSFIFVTDGITTCPSALWYMLSLMKPMPFIFSRLLKYSFQVCTIFVISVMRLFF